MYLDELAGRREQVVASTLSDYISDMDVAIGMLTAEDLASVEALQEYQLRMKQLYGLEKFAFVDETGLIYTSRGTRSDIDMYAFDYQTISGPEISVKNPDSDNVKVVIAVPTDQLPFNGHTLVASFMEIDMNLMLENISLQSGSNNTTFCNIYTSDDYVPSDQELSEVKMNEILSYLRLSHKYYLTSALSSLAATLDQLMEPCGETQRKVLQNFYLDYKREIEKHFEYEETNIFPLAEAIACGKKLSSNIFDQIEDDHSNIEEKIHDLKSIVMKYLPSECKEDIITVTLLMIYYLEKDLERHTAIEDTVLMPLMMRSNGE